MDEITIKLETCNAAFDGDFAMLECARILRALADDLERGKLPQDLRDVNGNDCGDVYYQGNDR